jgi:hypothetical protein
LQELREKSYTISELIAIGVNAIMMYVSASYDEIVNVLDIFFHQS